MTQFVRPQGAPGCWAMQYSDADPECGQCSFKDSCRPAVMNRLAAPLQQNTPYRPALPSVLPAPPPASLIPMGRPPGPPQVQYSYATPPAPAPQPASYTPTSLFRPAVPQPPVQQNVPFFSTPQPAQQQQPWAPPAPQPPPSLPDPNNPHPLSAMTRPGVMGSPYYLTQYPGETVSQRIVKNALLRALEAIFTELANFFRNWTMPPKR